MKATFAICLIMCLCLATTFAEEEKLIRIRRVTCGGILERLVGDNACDLHCGVIRKGDGNCREGTCHCSGRGSQ